jgi:putative transposase
MQLVAGRVAQEYNTRKHRRGSFWEDCYFAAAVSTDRHEIRCITYIDLNMIRASAVEHPSQWRVCGFNEIQSPRSRFRIIDMAALCKLTGSGSDETFRTIHREWVEQALLRRNSARQPEWTENTAVGPDSFTAPFKRE